MMAVRYVQLRKGIKIACTIAYKGEGDPKSINIKPAYLLNGLPAILVDTLLVAIDMGIRLAKGF